MMRFFAKANPTTKTADLYIYDQIGKSPWGDGGVGATDVKDALIEAKGSKTLNVYMNSPGGDVFEGVAIYSQLARFDGEIVVHVDGLAASAASVIAMAGTKIVTAFNGEWMIHNPWAFTMGQASDMRKAADMLDQVAETMIETYARRTKAKRDDIKSWMEAETWMDAETAKERGFTDEITEEKKLGADAKAFAMLGNFKNKPPSLASMASKIRQNRLDEVEAFINRTRASASVGSKR